MTDKGPGGTWTTLGELSGAEHYFAKLSAPRPQQKRYTLEEAKLELARRDCTVLGHDFEHVTDSGNNPTRVVCARCLAYWRVRKNP